MSDGMAVAGIPESSAQVEDLLFEEAARLDDRRFDDWLALFSADAIYWVPSGADTVDPRREVSVVYDDVEALRERVWRLGSGMAYAQDPPSRTVHAVANVQIVDSPDDLVHVNSVFSVTEFRRGRQFVHAGRYRHHLRREGDALQIVLKKVELVNNDGYLGNLSVIL